MKLTLIRLKRSTFGVYNYFKKRKRENLLTGMLLFISGIIVCYPGIDYFFKALDKYGLSILTVNSLIADSTYAILIAMPSFVLFGIAYLVWENHSWGWKLSAASCGISIILIVTNNTDSMIFNLGLILTGLTGLATVMQFRKRKASALLHKDSPSITENLAKFGLALSGVACIGILLGMIGYITIRGMPYLSWNFFTNAYWQFPDASRVISGESTGPIGGVLGFTVGSLLLSGFCELIAIPLGIGAAIYLAEYSAQNKLLSIIRFFIETLAGIPSIIIGLVGYGVLVTGGLSWGNSMMSGALALALMILPWNIRIAEEALKSVPTSYREAAYALGATQWQTIRRAVFFAASPGIITGILLGFGAALGETIVIAMTAGSAIGGGNTLIDPSRMFSTNNYVQTLPVFIWLAPQAFSLSGVGSGENGFRIYNVVFAASFVLILLYLVICVLALVLRNYLTKKITGR